MDQENKFKIIKKSQKEIKNIFLEKVEKYYGEEKRKLCEKNKIFESFIKQKTSSKKD